MVVDPNIVRKEDMEKFEEGFYKKLYKKQKEKGETALEEERFLNEYKLSTLISSAKYNQDDAIEILRLSVQFLKEADRGSHSIHLPVYLGNYLSRAFEKALEILDSSQAENKGSVLSKSLSDALHITSHNRRPTNKYDVASYMLQFIDSGMSLNKAALEASIDFKIDESTAKRCFKDMADFFNRMPNGKEKTK